MQSLAIDAATAEAVSALDAAGIPAVLLKGPAFYELLYDAGEERSWDDADLLVPARCEEGAARALAGIGYRPRLSDPLERGSVGHATHLVRESAAPGVGFESIDLHLGFAGVGNREAFWESVWADRGEIELLGRRVPVPSRPARLTLVALHAGSHGRGHARSMRDLERALGRFGGGEWTAAAELAARWEASDLFTAGLALTPAGEALLARLGLANRASRSARMRAAGAPRGLRPLEQLAATRGVRARAGLIRRRLFPSRELMLTWKPIARRGRLGLALAYAWRPPWVAWQVLVAASAYVRAGRGGARGPQ